MQTTDEIKKYAKVKKRQGYEGYQDTMEYFRKFDNSQLLYLENSYKSEVESTKRLSDFKMIVTLTLSISAIVFSAVPDNMKESMLTLYQMCTALLALTAFVYGVYLGIDLYTSNNINKLEWILGIIKNVKEERKQG